MGPESRAEQELFNLNRLIEPLLSSPEAGDAEHNNDGEILIANSSRNILASESIPESNIVPQAEPEILMPSSNKNNSSQPFYKQYEEIERSYTTNDHIISVQKNIT